MASCQTIIIISHLFQQGIPLQHTIIDIVNMRSISRMCFCCSVLQIVDIFQHPSDELREALQLHLEQFSPDDPYWQVSQHAILFLFYFPWLFPSCRVASMTDDLPSPLRPVRLLTALSPVFFMSHWHASFHLGRVSCANYFMSIHILHFRVLLI